MYSIDWAQTPTISLLPLQNMLKSMTSRTVVTTMMKKNDEDYDDCADSDDGPGVLGDDAGW